MAKKILYPLEQVLGIKKRRVEEAEKVVAQKKEALRVEEEKLKEREKERDKAKQHKIDKLQQLREELDHSTTSDKVTQMKRYLEVAKERLEVEEKKVTEQKEQVKKAEQAVEQAEEELRKRRSEVDKLENHRKDWMRGARRELEFQEEKEMDEIGGTMHLVRKIRSKGG